MDFLVKKIIDTGIADVNSLTQDSGTIYTFLNPVSYLDARKNRGLYANFDGIFADGSLLTSFIRIIHKKKVKRYSFDMTSVAPILFTYAIEANKSIYLVGSKQEEIEKAQQILTIHYPKLNIIGIRNGYFSSDEEINEEIENILKIKPDFVIVGMGAIRQEQFLLNMKNKGFSGIGFTCGGFLHQTSNNIINFYPRWIDNMNIRFLYRMYKEKHTRIRYLKAAFYFPVFFLVDCFLQGSNSKT
ncbi:WecB/TagA/CpsF family glycosyltransferase [Draconibacterium sediminis]|uniref:Glycosyl transferase n=1 Tax=Draconibacterium sediminis TaxID=1544798 RepID=A0A0D8JAY7_9BACT|nr:WecB/TagA/CpsF family glycosyltransferase [Draconibacterium sediminis]KJF43884.1 glycosyl transferase [Draconibacterium sediminis]